MPVVDGVDIPPPPGGGAPGPRRRPHRRPEPGQPPPFDGGPPPPIRQVPRGGGGLGVGANLLPVVGGALLVFVAVWTAISLVRGAVGVATTLGGATIEAASVASSAVSDRIEGARSAVSAAVPPNPFPRDTHPPRPIRPVTRATTGTEGAASAAARTPARSQGAEDGRTRSTHSPNQPAAARPNYSPSPTPTPIPRSAAGTRAASGSEPNVDGTWARSGYEAAKGHLVSGDYRAAHGRTEQTLEELASRRNSGMPAAELNELRRTGEELLDRVVRACHAERSVLLARGELAPECPG